MLKLSSGSKPYSQSIQEEGRNSIIIETKHLKNKLVIDFKECESENLQMRMIEGDNW
jgi:hypothetical protein